MAMVRLSVFLAAWADGSPVSRHVSNSRTARKVLVSRFKKSSPFCCGARFTVSPLYTNTHVYTLVKCTTKFDKIQILFSESTFVRQSSKKRIFSRRKQMFFVREQARFRAKKEVELRLAQGILLQFCNITQMSKAFQRPEFYMWLT